METSINEWAELNTGVTRGGLVELQALGVT